MYEQQMGITQRVENVREANENNAKSSVCKRNKWE